MDTNNGSDQCANPKLDRVLQNHVISSVGNSIDSRSDVIADPHSIEDYTEVNRNNCVACSAYVAHGPDKRNSNHGSTLSGDQAWFGRGQKASNILIKHNCLNASPHFVLPTVLLIISVSMIFRVAT